MMIWNHRTMWARLFLVLLLAGGFGVLASCGGGGGGGGGGPAAPGAFGLTAPVNNDVGVGLAPTLVWGSSSGVSTYTVQVTTDSSFNTITTYETTTIPAGTTSALLSGLSPSTTYYWRVLASNSVGTTAATGAPFSYTTKKSGDVEWAVTSAPSTYFNNAYTMKIAGPNMYLAGYDTVPGDGQFEWRMEKRSLSDGGLIGAFGTAGVIVSNPTATLPDAAYALALDASYLYAAGYDSTPGSSDYEWRIEKRDLITGVSITAFGTSGAVSENHGIGSLDQAESITVDSSPTGTIYTVGYVETSLAPVVREWRIEARDKATGLAVTAVSTASGQSENVGAYSIAIDENEGYMYVAGAAALGTTSKWRIEKRSLSGPLSLETTTFGTVSTPGIIISDPTGTYDGIPWALALDSTSIYIVGDEDPAPPAAVRKWRIESRSRIDGSLNWVVNSSTTTDAVANAVAVDAARGSLYVAGFDTTASGAIEWRIEKRSLATGALDSTFGTNGAVIKSFGTPMPLDSDIWSIAVDGDYLYVAGSEGYPDALGSRWRIEKIVK